MFITIYKNETVLVTPTGDGYSRVVILRDGAQRLAVDTRSGNIGFKFG